MTDKPSRKVSPSSLQTDFHVIDGSYQTGKPSSSGSHKQDTDMPVSKADRPSGQENDSSKLNLHTKVDNVLSLSNSHGLAVAGELGQGSNIKTEGKNESAVFGIDQPTKIEPLVLLQTPPAAKTRINSSTNEATEAVETTAETEQDQVVSSADDHNVKTPVKSGDDKSNDNRPSPLSNRPDFESGKTAFTPSIGAAKPQTPVLTDSNIAGSLAESLAINDTATTPLQERILRPESAHNSRSSSKSKSKAPHSRLLSPDSMRSSLGDSISDLAISEGSRSETPQNSMGLSPFSSRGRLISQSISISHLPSYMQPTVASHSRSRSKDIAAGETSPRSMASMRSLSVPRVSRS